MWVVKWWNNGFCSSYFYSVKLSVSKYFVGSFNNLSNDLHLINYLAELFQSILAPFFCQLCSFDNVQRRLRFKHRYHAFVVCLRTVSCLLWLSEGLEQRWCVVFSVDLMRKLWFQNARVWHLSPWKLVNSCLVWHPSFLISFLTVQMNCSIACIFQFCWFSQFTRKTFLLTENRRIPVIAAFCNQIQIMKGLDSKDLYSPFQHLNVIGDNQLIEWKVIFYLPFIFSV